MALTLLEIYQLHDDPQNLFKRIVAACGVMCRAILADATASRNAKMWANMVKADPQAVARVVLRGVVTDSAITSLSVTDLRDGTAPTDAQLLAVIQGLLTAFVS